MRLFKILSLFIFLAAILLPSPTLLAGQSTITETDSYACMGDDKSRKATEAEAETAAKRKAIERVSTYVKSETQVKDFQLQKDVIEAYANAAVKVIQEIERNWYQDAKQGECFRIRIKAEVIPDEKSMSASAASAAMDDPTAPLKIQLWTDKKEYRKSDKIKIYLQGQQALFRAGPLRRRLRQPDPASAQSLPGGQLFRRGRALRDPLRNRPV